MARGAFKSPWWSNDVKFRHMVHIDMSRVAEAGGGGPSAGALLAPATSFDHGVYIRGLEVPRMLST